MTAQGTFVTRYIVVLIAFVGLAGIVPQYFDRYSAGAGHGKHPAVPAEAPSETSATSSGLPQASYLGNGRVVSLHRNSKGHYSGRFELNGRQTESIIDTGATYVAMNQSTARDIGIYLSPSDFTYAVETANGQTKAARATIGSISIGRIREDNVEAFVLPDSAMPQTLIGMNFLNRLNSYQVRDGVLELKD